MSSAVARAGEEGTGLAALEQHRVALVVTREEANRAVAVPARERVGLVLGLAVRPGDLEDGGRPVGQLCADDVPARPRRIGLSEGQTPGPGHFGHEGRGGFQPLAFASASRTSGRG